MTDGVFIWKIFRGKRVIDQGNRRCLRIVAIVERTTIQERSAKYTEVVSADCRNLCSRQDWYQYLLDSRL
jgi:hypothetical protein